MHRFLRTLQAMNRNAGNRLPRVVVVGGGFAGVHVVKSIPPDEAHITLIDRQNHHLFQPLLYQVATAALSAFDIAQPIRAIFGDRPNLDVVMAEVTDIDLAANLSFLSTDITLNIINWTWAQDYFYATNFLGGTYDTRYLQPMTQIVFNAPTYTGDNTYWDSFDDQIYPVVPEPSTYGAIFTGLAAALFLLRKKLRQKRA